MRSLLINLKMQLSKRKLNKNIEKQLREMVIGVLTEVNRPEEIETILADLLTEGERMAVYKRLGIAIYLDKGRSYEDIKNNIKVSSATIASVAEDLNNPGFQEVIRRIKADEWAEKVSGNILKGIKKILPQK